MSFLTNAWYMVGWAGELAEGKLVHRTVANIPILVYRLSGGGIAAIEDRCPHRFVPLHMGKQIGDVIQCGYHGLSFDQTGACVKNPIDGASIPKTARTRSFPASERYGGLWIWLGDNEKADDSTIPDFAFLVDPRRATVYGAMLTKANYQLAIDNLTDLTHVQFVHGEFQASEAYPRLKTEVKEEGGAIYSHLTFPNGRPPKFYHNALADISRPIDLVYDVRWNAPASARLRVSGFEPDDRSTPLFEIQSAHIVTPETETTCHYFFGNSRDYAIGDPEADARVREWQRIGFEEQDKPMLEAQQRFVGTADIMSLKPALIGPDAAPVRIRRALKAMIEAEAGSA